jgi:PEP-CTERM motif-containing protein
MKLRKLVLSAAVTFAWVGAASAATLLNLTGPYDNTIGPQSESAPCIIAGTQCSQPDGFGYNNFTQTGNVTAYNVWSTTPTPAPNEQVDGPVGTNPYTVGQITGVVGTSFSVAIDVNTANGGETLNLFEVWNRTTDSLLYVYNGPTNIATGINNGNGWGDWTLGTVSLLGLPTDTLIQFHAVWSGASDGAESFFIVSTPAIPEPETYAMMLAGLSLLGFVARRRRQGLGGNLVPA